jgi:hypothetical protein
MLVNLTPNTEEIQRRKKIAVEHDFEYTPQSDPKWLQETGIYQSSIAFNFPKEEFIEELDEFHYSERKKKPDETVLQCYVRTRKTWIEQYGVADNIEQIKEFYKKQIKIKKDKFCIAVTPVWQDKENRGKGGGWRWHKWGKYIGKLNRQHEYLDDEDFGEDFKYVLCFHLYYIINK